MSAIGANAASPIPPQSISLPRTPSLQCRSATHPCLLNRRNRLLREGRKRLGDKIGVLPRAPLPRGRCGLLPRRVLRVLGMLQLLPRLLGSGRWAGRAGGGRRLCLPHGNRAGAAARGAEAGALYGCRTVAALLRRHRRRARRGRPLAFDEGGLLCRQTSGGGRRRAGAGGGWRAGGRRLLALHELGLFRRQACRRSCRCGRRWGDGSCRPAGGAGADGGLPAGWPGAAATRPQGGGRGGAGGCRPLALHELSLIRGQACRRRRSTHSWAGAAHRRRAASGLPAAGAGAAAAWPDSGGRRGAAGCCALAFHKHNLFCRQACGGGAHCRCRAGAARWCRAWAWAAHRRRATSGLPAAGAWAAAATADRGGGGGRAAGRCPLAFNEGCLLRRQTARRRGRRL